jgi:hypothetical protein
MRLSHVLAFAAAVSALVFACSSTTTTSSSGSSGTSNVDAGPAPADGSTADGSITSTKDSAADTGPVDPCAGETTNEGCQLCCATANKDAYLAFQNALLGCACKAAVCQTQCATTACAATPSQPDAACTTCLNGAQTGACKTDVETVCTGGGACVPFYNCISKSCAGKL